jgi:hypothetical protein
MKDQTESDRMKPPVIEPGKVTLGKIVEPRRPKLLPLNPRSDNSLITTSKIGPGRITTRCLRCGKDGSDCLCLP